MLDRNKEIKSVISEMLIHLDALQNLIPEDRLIVQAYSILYHSLGNFSMLMGSYEIEQIRKKAEKKQ